MLEGEGRDKKRDRRAVDLSTVLKDSAIVRVSPSLEICIGHRPGKKLIPVLAANGFTDVATILGPREAPHELGSLVTECGMAWHWIPIGHGNVPGTVEDRERFSEYVVALHEVLIRRANARLFVHCSAGIHRTGMFTLAFLKCGGVEPDKVLHLLEQARPLTHANVGADRIEFALTLFRQSMEAE